MPVANVKSGWESGDLVFRDNSGNGIFEVDGPNRAVDILSGAALKLDGAAITATADEINMAADLSKMLEVVTTTNVITAAESGKKFILANTTGAQQTLPTPAAGLSLEFIVGMPSPTGGNWTIVSAGTTQKVIKGLVVAATNQSGDVSAGGTTVTFVSGSALPGDRVRVDCDGTYWYAFGAAQVAAGITITGE